MPIPFLAVILIVSTIGASMINLLIFPELLKLPFFQMIKSTGFTYYGGLLVFIPVFILTTKFLNNNIEKELNEIVPFIVLFHAIGRVGCFFAGCCYGKIWHESSELFFHLERIPTQLISALFLFLFYFFLININSKRMLYYMIFYPLFRFSIEFFRDDPRGFLLFENLFTSQEISIAIFTLGLIWLGKIALQSISQRKVLYD